MKLHEIQNHYWAKIHNWWEWLPATIKGSPNRVNRGWKPLPQPIWLKLTFLLFFKFCRSFRLDQTDRFSGQRLG